MHLPSIAQYINLYTSLYTKNYFMCIRAHPHSHAVGEFSPSSQNSPWQDMSPIKVYEEEDGMLLLICAKNEGKGKLKMG